MRMTEITYTDSKPVDGYGPGYFRLGGERIEGAVLLMPTGVRTWLGYAEVQPILDGADDIDVLLVGTGSDIAHLPADLRARLEAAGIGVETMASPAACRTYNVLIAEGRRVGAALLPV